MTELGHLPTSVLWGILFLMEFVFYWIFLYQSSWFCCPLPRPKFRKKTKTGRPISAGGDGNFPTSYHKGVFYTSYHPGLKRIQQLSHRLKKQVFALFVDLSAAFDHVIRIWLFKSLYQRLAAEQSKNYWNCSSQSTRLRPLLFISCHATRTKESAVVYLSIYNDNILWL